MSNDSKRRIEVPVLARVEGEGALELTLNGGEIEELALRIYEPPRLFEQFLVGHDEEQTLDAVARICGICPVAYQMTAVQAFERLYRIDPGPWVNDMRRVMYCGEWLQSHALHMHLLAAPDFLGYEHAIAMAADHPEVVRRGLRLQTLGNDLIALLGGRSVHPVGLKVGGFHRAPSVAEVAVIRERLQAALPESEELVRWAAGIAVPDDQRPFTSVALSHPGEYAIYGGRIQSGDGLDIDPSQYEKHFEEFQVPHSTALHAHLHERPYLVGPLARLNLNFTQLPEPVLENLKATGIRLPSHNMFHSLLARAVEVHLVVYEALRLLSDYRLPEAPSVSAPRVAGSAVGATEAPRGLLWHRYEMDAEGHVCWARIVPPTSQNQARCEQDLHDSLLAFGLDREEEALRLHAETVIRNYDPCISCATHFLKLNVSRR